MKYLALLLPTLLLLLSCKRDEEDKSCALFSENRQPAIYAYDRPNTDAPEFRIDSALRNYAINFKANLPYDSVRWMVGIDSSNSKAFHSGKVLSIGFANIGTYRIKMIGIKALGSDCNPSKIITDTLIRTIVIPGTSVYRIGRYEVLNPTDDGWVPKSFTCEYRTDLPDNDGVGASILIGLVKNDSFYFAGCSDDFARNLSCENAVLRQVTTFARDSIKVLRIFNRKYNTQTRIMSFDFVYQGQHFLATDPKEIFNSKRYTVIAKRNRL